MMRVLIDTVLIETYDCYCYCYVESSCCGKSSCVVDLEPVGGAHLEANLELRPRA